MFSLHPTTIALLLVHFYFNPLAHKNFESVVILKQSTKRTNSLSSKLVQKVDIDPTIINISIHWLRKSTKWSNAEMIG